MAINHQGEKEGPKGGEAGGLRINCSHCNQNTSYGWRGKRGSTGKERPPHPSSHVEFTTTQFILKSPHERSSTLRKETSLFISVFAFSIANWFETTHTTIITITTKVIANNNDNKSNNNREL